jgi:hypothetical protein
MKGFGGMQQFVRQATQMQNKMKKLQEERAERFFEGSSGGGAVKVTVKGENTLTALVIQEEVFKSGDVEMLQDLILTATNDALKQSKDIRTAEMDKVTGGMGGMPGLF